MPSPFLFPLGQDLGPLFADPDSPTPQRYDIRIGDGVFMLEAPEYQLWWLAHGTPELVKQHNGWDREQVAAYSAHYRIADAPAMIDQLIADRVFAQVELEIEAVTEFAQAHRVFPLHRSLGNTAADPLTYRLGSSEQTSVDVDVDIFQLWAFGHQSESLHQAAVTLAAQRAENENMPDELVPTAEELCQDFVLALPRMIAAQVVYVDRRS